MQKLLLKELHDYIGNAAYAVYNSESLWIVIILLLSVHIIIVYSNTCIISVQTMVAQHAYIILCLLRISLTACMQTVREYY